MSTQTRFSSYFLPILFHFNCFIFKFQDKTIIFLKPNTFILIFVKKKTYNVILLLIFNKKAKQHYFIVHYFQVKLYIRFIHINNNTVRFLLHTVSLSVLFLIFIHYNLLYKSSYLRAELFHE